MTVYKGWTRVIKHDKNYTSFVVKIGERGGALIQGKALFKILADRRGTYLKGALLPGER